VEVGTALRLSPGRLSQSLKSALGRMVRMVWLRQPERLRVRVPSSSRMDVRAEVLRIQELVRTARRGEPGPVRDELVTRALLATLAVLGRASDPSATDAAAAVRAGTSRVAATLHAEALQAFTAFSGPDSVTPLSERRFRELLELCEWTGGLVDNRSERERKMQRWASRAALAIAVVAGLHAMFGNRNLALGRKVTSSSVCSLSPPARYHQPRLSRVVDGVIFEGPGVGVEWGEATFAMCTDAERHPWLTLDLGELRTLSQAVVYSRSDCCWGDELPLSIQVSSDDEHFVTVATTTTPFTTEFPWKPSLGGKKARYVRLYSGSSAKKSIVVSELEVYGR